MEWNMTEDEMKNRISMALKDPILQQGFECICKDLAISEHDREHNDYELTEVYKKVEQLEKEKCELLGIIQGKDKAIADLKKENEELWTHSAHLTALVEKMKCCANCENYCQRIDHRCNTECKNHSLWKLNEDFGWRTESN